MRVSIDSRYIRERPSGIGRYVDALVQRVPALAPRDEFHFWADPRARQPLSSAENARETRVPAPANGVRTLLCPGRLVDLFNVDVLHAPFNILGRGVACPSVVTIHDLMWLLRPDLAEGLSLRTPVQALYYRDGLLRALRRASRIVAISNATATSISQYLPSVARKLRVIPHGVDAGYVPPTDRAGVRAIVASWLGIEAPFFLVVGQNTPSKNHAAVLQAFAQARFSKPVYLVFVQRLYAHGRFGGFGARCLPRLARSLGASRRIVWLERTTEVEMIRLLQSAVALIQFSRFEGFGLPALEAMACGTPVVGSDIPALVELLGGAGLTLPLRIRELGCALERLIREPSLRTELSMRGVQRSLDFSWERSAKLHLETYREAFNAG